VETYTPNPEEMESPDQKRERKKNLRKRIAKHDKRLNDLQSSAFSVANCYFVFQGVILTIVCDGAQNLKPSNRWFLLTLSILAILFNLFALIRIGIKIIDTKAERKNCEYKLKNKKKNFKPDEKDKQLKIEDYMDKSNFYLYIYIIIFLGFAAVVLVGCWKFIGNQNE
jgi:hypothetical protein